MPINGESIKILSNSTKTQQGNLAGVGAFGQKRFEDVFVEGRAGTKESGVSFLTSKQRTTINEQGQVTSTGVNSDLCIEGDGMFIAASAANSPDRVYTRRGDFRQDELGFWKNGAGFYLFGWKLDQNGELPPNSSTLSSLTAINFANTKGTPKATTSISIAMNLNSDRAALRGAGPNFAFNRSGKNNATAKSNKDDIILPETLIGSGIEQGFRQKIKSIPPGNQQKILEYGGIALARGATSLSPVFGATSSTKRFDTNLITQGSGLQITVGTESFSFECVVNNPESRSGQFNSIISLSEAINKTSRLKATLDSTTGVMYIAAKEQFVNEAISFKDTGGATFVQELGLTDIAATQPGVKRYNSLISLQSAVNSDDDIYELKARITGQTIDITTKNPTSDFEINVDSFGKRNFSHAVLGDDSERGRGAITIKSPNSGLKTGDLIKIENVAGYGNQFAPGIYAVGKVDNSIGFEIYLVTNSASTAANVNNDITDGLRASTAQLSMNFPAATWQKLPGGSSVQKNASISASNDGGAGNKTVTITDNAHGLAAGDVILVQGGGSYNFNNTDIQLPDGYYIVSANNLTANNFEIQAYNLANNPAQPIVNAFSYYKVGKVENPAGGLFNQANGISTFDSAAVFEVALGDTTVKLNMPNNNYSEGDYISFQGLAPGYNISNIVVENDKRYKITERTQDYIRFEVVGAPAAAGNVTSSYSTAAGGVGDLFRVNNGTRVLEYFGLGNKQKDEDKRFLASYDPQEVNKSLSGTVNLGIANDAKAFPSSDIFNQTLRAYDSLGSEFSLQIHFAKLSENEWAVEVASEKDPQTGLFDVKGIGADGKIAHGRIFFDSDGVFDRAEGGIAEALNFERRNGSALTNIEIDWTNSANTIKTGSVTQYKKLDSFEFTQQNGQAAGTLMNVEADEEGYLIGTFDTGEVKQLYKVPIATFPNINGLKPASGGVYEISKESGDLLIKGANTAGAGKIIGGALEASNTNTTDELITLKQRSMDLQANSNATKVEIENIQRILETFRT